MGAFEILALAITHPHEFRILLQFWNYHEPKRDITRKEEHPSSGWDRPAMRRCWELLDFTSRSFASVIKELDGDLGRVVSCHGIFHCRLSQHGCTTDIYAHTPRYAYSMSSSAASILSKMT
jgi:hypothetical protein